MGKLITPALFGVLANFQEKYEIIKGGELQRISLLGNGTITCTKREGSKKSSTQKCLAQEKDMPWPWPLL